MDVGVEFVSVFPDREFLVVVNGDVDSPVADWFVFRVVELSDVGMSQCLLSAQTLSWVELQQIADQIQSIVRSSREHVTKASCLGWWERFKHCWCQRTVDGFNILL